MKKKRTFYRVLTIVIPFAVLFLLIERNLFFNFTALLPPCPIYSAFHLYCPACGDTRSIISLLHGDLLSALRYNVIPVLFSLFLFLFYLELAAYSFGKPVRILPRRLNFYFILLVLLVFYLIFRNFIPYLTP